jgi:Tfp pilus assembly protein PilV
MRYDHRGFTVIETLISISLLTGALVVLAQVAAMSVRANATARHRSVAILLAEQKLEQIRSQPAVDDVADAFDYLSAAGVPECEGAEACTEGIYLRRWSVGPMAGAPNAVLLTVAVRHAQYGEVSLVTARARRLR